MPIKRLQRTEGQPQFPCIGKLRKGGERPSSGKAPGKDLDHFRFTSDDERAMEMFEHAYGKEPQAINVYLPMPTTDENFTSWQEAWAAGGLHHRCDGETCVIWFDPQAGKYSQEPKPCPGGCKEVGRLMVIIPELQRMAYVTAETHGIWDIITIDERLRAVESVAGTLTGIPFILKRVKKSVSTPGQDGKRVRRDKWMIDIEVDPVWAAIRLDAMHRQALTTASGNHPMLVDSLSDFEDYEHGLDDGDYDGVVDGNEPYNRDTLLESVAKEAGVILSDYPPESLADAEPDTSAHLATPVPVPDPPVFGTIKKAMQWAVEFQAYDNVDDARTVYDEIKAELKPSNAVQMYAAWIEHCRKQASPAEAA